MIKMVPLLIVGWLLCGCGPGGKSPSAALENYLRSNTVEERGKWVRHPESVLPLMASHYRGLDIANSAYVLDEPVPLKVSSQNWVSIRVFKRGENAWGLPVEDVRFYALQKTPKGWRVDWESAVGYNPISWAEFRATLPAAPVKFRLRAKLGTHFPYTVTSEFDKALLIGAYWSIVIDGREASSPDVPILLYGYAEKQSEAGRLLFEILRDGQQHYLTCILRAPMPGHRDEHHFFELPMQNVMVDEVLDEGWLEWAK